MRVCSKCGIAKPPEGFYSSPKARGRRCKECIRTTNQVHAHKRVRKPVVGKTERKRAQEKDYRVRLRLSCIVAYGGKCECCGESRAPFLAIDHIGGSGNKQRREAGLRSSVDFYRWLRDNNWPTGFRVLCHNCNLAYGFYGACPHQVEP